MLLKPSVTFFNEKVALKPSDVWDKNLSLTLIFKPTVLLTPSLVTSTALLAAPETLIAAVWIASIAALTVSVELKPSPIAAEIASSAFVLATP